MTGTPEEDPFEAFARSLETVEEAKKSVAEKPSPRPVGPHSTIQEIIDFYASTFLSTKREIALAKAVRAAAKELLYAKVLSDDDVDDGDILFGNEHAIEIEKEARPVFDKAKLRAIDVPDGRQPPAGIAVSYKPDKSAPISTEVAAKIADAKVDERESISIKVIANGAPKS